VKYSLGSVWVPVSAGQQTFTAVGGAPTDSGAGSVTDDAVAAMMINATGTAAGLASAPFTPPNAPQVFTTFLLGSKAFGYSLLPQVHDKTLFLFGFRESEPSHASSDSF